MQAGNGTIPYTSYIECGIQTDTRCEGHKNKRIQTQRQPYGIAYVQTSKMVKQVESQTIHLSVKHSSSMTEPMDRHDQGAQTRTCFTESKHMQTMSSCTTRGTQYKQRYTSGGSVSQDVSTMTPEVKMRDNGVEMEAVKVCSRYTQSHVSVKTMGTQATNGIQQLRPYATVASPARPPAWRQSQPSWFVGGRPSKHRDFLIQQVNSHTPWLLLPKPPDDER